MNAPEMSATAQALLAQQQREAKRETDARDRAQRISSALKERQFRRDAAQQDREQRRSIDKRFIPSPAALTGPKKKEFQRALEVFVPMFGNLVDMDIVIKEWQLTLESLETSGHTAQTDWSTGAYDEGPPQAWTADGEHTHTFTASGELTAIDFGTGFNVGYGGGGEVTIDSTDYTIHYTGVDASGDTYQHNHTVSGEQTASATISVTVTPGSPDGAHKHTVVIPALEYTYVLYNLDYTESRTTYICIRGGGLIGFFASDDPNKPASLPEAKTLTFNIVVP